MKKIFVMLLCLILCLGLVGCGGSEADASTGYYEIVEYDRFVLWKKYDDCSLYLDKETMVMYVWRTENDGSQWGVAGFTALLDAEGKPVILNK